MYRRLGVELETRHADAEANVERLAALFRVLADPTRLRILGQLAERPRTGADLGRALGLTAPTISHHMGRLLDAGFVTAVAKGASRRYALDQRALSAAAPVIAAPADGAGAGEGQAVEDGDDGTTRVLRDFFDGERLVRMPARRKKRVVVLQHVLTRFRPGVDYPEREVNATLKAIFDDVATLRRELVDYGFMTRADGVYRVASALPPRGPTVAQEMPPDERGWLRNLIAAATDDAIADRPTEPSTPD